MMGVIAFNRSRILVRRNVGGSAEVSWGPRTDKAGIDIIWADVSVWGVTNDCTAREWYQKSAAQGYEKAVEALKNF